MAHMFMPVYNVDAPVGAGEANSPDDVRLVQKLFLALRGPLVQRFVGLPALMADGRFSPALETRIRAFQGSSNVMAQDGKIHPIPARDGHFVTRIGAYRPTLLLLNYNCMHHDPVAHRLIAEELHLLIRTHMS
jgi:hypothetical protein